MPEKTNQDKNHTPAKGVNWLPFCKENDDLYCRKVAYNENTLILFDTGETCRWIDTDWPMAIATHFEG